jgi:trafficking protein particle complex subunit 9
MESIVPGLATDLQMLNLAKKNGQIQQLVIELPEKFREIISLYDRATQVGELGYYPILQHEACFKIATFLTNLTAANFIPNFINGAGIVVWSYEKNTIQDELASVARSAVGDKPVNKLAESAPADETNLKHGSSSRLEILSWALRAWQTGSEYLNLKDQVMSLSNIANICYKLKFKRKAAFYLRLAGFATQVLAQKKPGGTIHPAPAVQCLLKAFYLLSADRLIAPCEGLSL